MRLENWEQAAQKLDALDAKERDKPAHRYARARVAHALSDYARVVKLLDGLQKHLPFLVESIGYYRAEAQLHTGPVEEAARYFAARSTVRGLTKAALAWERAGRLSEAKAAIDRAIGLAGKRRDDETVKAYRVRARIAEAAGKKALALADLRIVAEYAGTEESSDEVGKAIARLDPSRALTATERLNRADRMASRGDSARALREIDRARTAPGNKPGKAQMTSVRAMAIYRGREGYEQAAQLFEEAARLGGSTTAPRALYYAAKSWTRADQNERGLKLYRELGKRYSRSPWAERALYQIARLHRLNARWSEAAREFARYLKRYERGIYAEDARYSHALCLLLSGRNRVARTKLERLAKAETKSRLHLAVLRHLTGIAAHAAGDKKGAIRIWRAVIRRDPLSWPAQAAATRLALHKEPVPQVIDPPPSSRASPINVSLPPVVRVLAELGLDAEGEEHLRRVEGHLTKTHPTRKGEALCLAYGKLDLARRRYRVAQKHVPLRLVQMAPSASNRWAWDCLYPTPHAVAVSRLEARYAIPEGLVYSVMRQESAFDKDALSPAGARGLMQLMPKTARETAARLGMKFDPASISRPHVNLELGTSYLSYLMRMFQNRTALAVAAYNAGPKAVGLWLERAGSLPLDLWIAQIPYTETRRYVSRVMGNVARYGYRSRGEPGIPRVDLTLPKDVKVPADAY